MSAGGWKSSKSTNEGRYQKIRAVDGRHPFKELVPGGYVEYEARVRRGGKLTYFNFGLAKEMGLIAKSHPDQLNRELEQAVLDAFAIVIINEYDITHGAKFSKDDIKPHRYMATRYLQLQHPGRLGLTSGDGRSIWNGYTVDRLGRTWDISSCGTGATCLSPATAINGRFYKTGDKEVSYGCGYSTLSEGLIDVLMSEIFTANGIRTERVLAVIEFPGGYAIKVRAGLNLLRPSHFFNHLRQEQFQRLKGAVDAFIDRQVRNGEWKQTPKGKNRYEYMLERVTETLAKITAQFEAEYVFCWLDWDGDNVLVDGSIVDFGSIRQFGLYHHEYRFDDVERWSTNIKEQKYKARVILQTFAQLVDYLVSGKKKPRRRFRRHACLQEFWRVFAHEKRRLLLSRMGFKPDDVVWLIANGRSTVRKWEKIFYAFEAAKSRRGPVKVPDGISWNAIYSMRDILRTLPQSYADGVDAIGEKEFLATIKTSYADRESLRLTPRMRAKIRAFQTHYRELAALLAERDDKAVKKVFAELAARSAVINRQERITGDAVCFIAEDLMKHRKKLSPDEFHRLIHAFIADQTLVPGQKSNSGAVARHNERLQKLLEAANEVVKQYREGL